MDPLTHGMIGLALSTFSGQSVSLSSPIALGCAIGAMIPDVDSIIRLYADDAKYLKQHRGFSHSLPMLVVFSGLVATVLAVIFGVSLGSLFEVHSFKDFVNPNHFGALWLWSFLGSLSHTFFDMLNSYGAMLLRKKQKLNLLTLYDPIIAVMGIGLIAQRQISWDVNFLAVVSFCVYMYSRYRGRQTAAVALAKRVEFEGSVNQVAVLPALTAFYRWDFIVTTQTYTYVGKYNQWNQSLRIVERLDAQCPHLREAFDKTALGEYFNDFSPHLHIVHTNNGPEVTMRIVDLRYYVKSRFLHQATLVIDTESGRIYRSILHPYGLKRSVFFQEQSISYV